MRANTQISFSVVETVAIDVVDNLPFRASRNKPMQQLETNILAILVDTALDIGRAAANTNGPSNPFEKMQILLIDKGYAPCNFN